MLTLLTRLTQINSTVTRWFVLLIYSFQDACERPCRILARLREPTISIAAYDDLISLYIHRGNEIARLKRENAILLRQVVARHVRRAMASDDWHCSKCGNPLCSRCGSCHYCGSTTCGVTATQEVP